MDPFLLTHAVGAGLYDVASRLAPISIRDQMLRGATLVSRALRENLIGPNKSLLVIGAGAAGATAAITAARQQVPTTLLERSGFVFSLQANARRYLDPTIYDWPAAHWMNSKFEWAGSAVPLRWKEGYSPEISAGWEHELEDEAATNTNLTIVKGAVLDRPHKILKSTRTPLRVFFRSATSKQRMGPHRFAMIVSCIGAGSERVEIGNFRGKAFWEKDSLARDNLGLPTYMTPRVMISGGGDGALQDFLRIVTNRVSPKEVFSNLPPGIQNEVAAFIASKEDHYQRAYIWSGNYDGRFKSDDCNIQKSLHADYLEIVNRVLTRDYSALTARLDPLLRFTESMTVSLAFDCDHFSHCYPLNHFLALLIALYLEQRFRGRIAERRILFPRTRIVGIKPLDPAHHCDPARPYECEEESHEVFFMPADCQTSHVPAAGSLMTSSYNVLIIRHGIDWQKNPPLFRNLPNRRHLLPYYLGW